MKTILSLLALLALSAMPTQAQCKDCGCKEKCSPKCRCELPEKAQ